LRRIFAVENHHQLAQFAVENHHQLARLMQPMSALFILLI